MIYSKFSVKADQIELALRRIGRWQDDPLPADKYENLGAFGENTMSFEQWIQFILIQRIRDIIKQEGEFPTESSVAAYAVRNMDGDQYADELITRLQELDDLIENTDDQRERGVEDEGEQSSNANQSNGGGKQREGGSEAEQKTPPLDSTASGITSVSQTVKLGDQPPYVVYQLAEVLHEFDGDMLESQLQTFDTFISLTDANGRQTIAGLIEKAAEKAINPVSKERILTASRSVASGKRAAEPYNHEEALRKYREEFKKNFK